MNALLHSRHYSPILSRYSGKIGDIRYKPATLQVCYAKYPHLAKGDFRPPLNPFSRPLCIFQCTGQSWKKPNQKCKNT